MQDIRRPEVSVLDDPKIRSGKAMEEKDIRFKHGRLPELQCALAQMRRDLRRRILWPTNSDCWALRGKAWIEPCLAVAKWGFEP